jgi:hypothetical protein
MPYYNLTIEFTKDAHFNRYTEQQKQNELQDYGITICEQIAYNFPNDDLFETMVVSTHCQQAFTATIVIQVSRPITYGLISSACYCLRETNCVDKVYCSEKEAGGGDSTPIELPL